MIRNPFTDDAIMITWSQSPILYTIDASLGIEWRAAIMQSLDDWMSVVPYTFNEIPLGAAQLVFAPVSAVLALPGVPVGYTPDNVNVTFTNPDGSGVISYVGLGNSSWPKHIVALHEIGHMFGIEDRPLTYGDVSLYGYQFPRPTGLTADIFDDVQQDGASPRDDHVIVTGSSRGILSCGAGRDTVSGSHGDEIIYGNTGDDTISGAAGSDILYGGQDRDALDGGSDADILYGNRGDDTLVGGDGADWLHGGQENDIIYGGDRDTVIGGLGNDVLYVTKLTVIGQLDPGDVVIEWIGQ